MLADQKRQDEVDRAAAIRATMNCTVPQARPDTSKTCSPSIRSSSSPISVPSSEPESSSSRSAQSGLDSHLSNSDSDRSDGNLPMIPDKDLETQDDLERVGHYHDSDFRPWDDDFDDDLLVPGQDEDSMPPSSEPIPRLNNSVPETVNTTNGDLEDDGVLPTAFWAHRVLCLLYLQTVIGNIFDSRTVLASNSRLSNGLDLLEATGITLEQSVKPATTLSTTK